MARSRELGYIMSSIRRDWQMNTIIGTTLAAIAITMPSVASAEPEVAFERPYLVYGPMPEIWNAPSGYGGNT